MPYPASISAGAAPPPCIVGACCIHHCNDHCCLLQRPRLHSPMAAYESPCSGTHVAVGCTAKRLKTVLRCVAFFPTEIPVQKPASESSPLLPPPHLRLLADRSYALMLTDLSHFSLRFVPLLTSPQSLVSQQHKAQSHPPRGSAGLEVIIITCSNARLASHPSTVYKLSVHEPMWVSNNFCTKSSRAAERSAELISRTIRAMWSLVLSDVHLLEGITTHGHSQCIPYGNNR